jgi:uncharacterized membrane protein YagU involved in acid resistance
MLAKVACNKRNILNGIIAGLVAGVVFGFMLIQMGVMANLGMMVNSPNPFAGFIVHLVFCAILGIIFAIIFYKKITTSFSTAILWGLVYGVIWWFIGTLTLAPIAMGVPVVWSGGVMATEFPMLIGNLVFGFVLGLCYFWLKNRK